MTPSVDELKGLAPSSSLSPATRTWMLPTVQAPVTSERLCGTGYESVVTTYSVDPSLSRYEL